MESLILLSVVLGAIGLLAFVVLRALKASNSEASKTKEEDNTEKPKAKPVRILHICWNLLFGNMFFAGCPAGTNQEGQAR